ncbi:MAG: metallophosphoesterase [Burkholderiales bacterium]
MVKNDSIFIDNKIKPDALSRNVLHRRAYAYIGNNSLNVTNIEYTGAKVPQQLYGFKIAHISDLHNHDFGGRQSRLIRLVKKERPDIITVTGDLIDRRRTDIKTAMDFIRGAVNLAPVYFVTGNHEIKSRRCKELFAQLKEAGVNMLDAKSVAINQEGGCIRLFGLPDISYYGYETAAEKEKAKLRLQSALKDLTAGHESSLNILLTHRPELIRLFSGCGIDIVLSGHAHGGQMRLPFLGGLYAPGQGVLPKYTSGMYHKYGMALVVSRGLGNSLFPLRIFDPPEVVMLKLKTSTNM